MTYEKIPEAASSQDALLSTPNLNNQSNLFNTFQLPSDQSFSTTSTNASNGHKIQKSQYLEEGEDIKMTPRNGSMEFLMPVEVVITEEREEDLLMNEKRIRRGSVSSFKFCFGLDFDKNLAMESLPSLLFSMIGLIFAGALLDEIQHWQVFTQISELIMMIPVLLNLKGNLEMNMSVRLSTAANLGQMETKEKGKQLILGNLALMQLQSIIIGMIATFFSLLLGAIVHPKANNPSESLWTMASGMTTASVTSFLLGSLMCLIVYVSKKLNMNPDNISTPLAASLGDLITLGVLSLIAHSLFTAGGLGWSLTLIILEVSMLPVLIYYLKRNPVVHAAIYKGWIPLFVSMFISSFAGLVLERYIQEYKVMAVLSPVLNGMAGNLGAIYTSRLSTALHGGLLENHARTKWTLFLINLPIQLIFMFSLQIFHLGHVQLTFAFSLFYILVSCLVLTFVLLMTKHICIWLWMKKMDPHYYALPYMTSFGDVFGTLVLVFGFKLLALIKDPSAN